ncbi:hypothetical protein CASFOL_040283 [Castilleja foliolosa]|uniref:peroxidase n=1 Tax=Castilleja foliolosa TaxID=1961234 RepID=A0ABD3BFE0_9LAMI
MGINLRGNFMAPPLCSTRMTIPLPNWGSFMDRSRRVPPKSDGSEPLTWLYKAREYFEFYGISSDERLRLVASMLEGPAAVWFRWRISNGLIDDWDDFVWKFKYRFDLTFYVDHVDQSKKSQSLETSSTADITSLSSSIAAIKAKVAEIQRNLINNAPQECAIREVSVTDGLMSQTKQDEVTDMVEDTELVELVELKECDASILLDDISLKREKSAAANLHSIDVVDHIKKAAEKECKSVIPCAHIIALAAARDLVFNFGDHDWSVKLGNLHFVSNVVVRDLSAKLEKRDSRTASLTYFLIYTLRTRWFLKRGRMLWIRGRGPKSGRLAKMRSKEPEVDYLAIQLFILLSYLIVYCLLFYVLGLVFDDYK